MRYLLILLLFIPTIIACSPKPAPQTVPLKEGALHVTELSYEDGVLSGKVINRTKQSFSDVHLQITFRSPCGKTIFQKVFPVVPGADKKLLSPGLAKHFTYKVRLKWRGRREPLISGTVVKTVPALKGE